MRKYLTQQATETLVHAYVSSRLDYCNSLFYGLTKYLIQRIQHVLNTAARIVTLSMKHDHITPIAYMLHWFPVEQQNHFKLLLTTFKALRGQALDYIRYVLEPIEEYRLSRSLRSDNCMLLSISDFNRFIMEGELLVKQPPGSGITSK